MEDRSKKLERLKESKDNSNRVTQEKFKSQKAITLVSLVVTIVILIILATVSINVLLGEGGLINQAKTAKFETEKASAREQIELVLVQAAMDKALNNEYNENEYLDKFVEDRLKGVWLEQDEISYDGFIFALDRSVPKIGNYTGQDEGPRIKEIKVTGKTTNSVSIEVDARNAEGGKYTYSYKKDSEGEDAWKEVATEVEENTCTFYNLEENEIYNLKVRIETSEGEIEQTINEMTGEVPKGTITFDEVEWVGDGTAKVRINTTETGYTMQYIIVRQGESTEGLPQKNWSEIASGSEITELYLGDTVYARLYDGKNESDYASVTVEDKIKPVVTVNPNGAATSNSIRVSVQAQDNESGMKDNLTYTYYIKQTSEGEVSYQVPVGATSIASNTYTFTELTQGTSYDVKVEVNGDKANNVGTGILDNQTTGTVPGGETGVEEGAITFGNTTWGSNNKASVTVNTNTSYTIEYQVGNIEEGSWTEIEKGGTIGNLNYNDTVYARLTDGTNHGDYASVTIEDKIAPEVTVTGKGTTSNSVTVSASATDGQSGMKDSITYTYSIKETGADDSTYSTPSNAQNISASSYTFTGLTQGKNYTVRVQVNGDKARNVGTGILENQTTGTVPGGEGGLQTGNITASAPTWSNGTASITLSTSTGLTIQYQVNNTIEGNWTTGTNVTGLHHGDTVFARLTDGNNYGEEASVNILDGKAPTVNFTTTKTHESISVTVTATDGESGLADNNIYTYTINGGSSVTKNTNTHTFSGLTAETPYTIKVEVKDKANNAGSKQETVKTEQKPIPSVEEAKTEGTVFKAKTPIKDGKDNTIMVPAGFKIAEDSGNTVQQGIVIEDVSASTNTNVQGSQYVWIPVGTFIKDSGTKSINIQLARYTFSTSSPGTPTVKQYATNYTASTVISKYYTESITYDAGYESSGSSSRNATAKDLKGFIDSVEENGGYYIGRYEASYASGSSTANYKAASKASTGNSTSSMSYTKGTLWNNIKQLDASKVAINTYAESNSVISDLINSYAWDTVIVYIKEAGYFNYANQTSENTSLANTGANNDEVCKINDLASNISEWTTEHSSSIPGSSSGPCVSRGGYYNYSGSYTAFRESTNTVYGRPNTGFRIQLYM